MNVELLAIIGFGSAILLAQIKTNEHLAETNRRLQTFWEEWVNPTSRR